MIIRTKPKKIMSTDENNTEVVEETQDDVQEDTQDSQEETKTYTEEEVEAIKKEAKKEQDRRWKERVKPILSQEEEKAEHSEDKDGSPSDAVLARLELRGVTDPTDQKYVIKAAKAEGVSPVDILNEEFVKDRLERNKQERKQKESSINSNNRTNAKPTSNVDKYVAEFKKTGELPDDLSPALYTEIHAALRKKN